MYLLGLNNSVADALSKEPGEASWLDEVDIGDTGREPCVLQNPIVFVAVDYWLQVVVPHLFLTGCIKAMKTAFSSGCPVDALACKKCSRQYLAMENMAIRVILHNCVLSVATSGMSNHKSKVNL